MVSEIGVGVVFPKVVMDASSGERQQGITNGVEMRDPEEIVITGVNRLRSRRTAFLLIGNARVITVEDIVSKGRGLMNVSDLATITHCLYQLGRVDRLQRSIFGNEIDCDSEVSVLTFVVGRLC